MWEPQTTKLLLKLCERGGHAVVGGAYFGDQVILMARRLAQAGGTCHAFEPNADQLGMLRNNATLNHVENIRSWRLGLWSDSTTQLRLVGHDSFAHAEHSDGPAGDDSFSTITIDEYCAQQNVDKLGLIMLDIEGAELNVFKGAAKQLARPAGEASNLVFEVHRHYVDWSAGLQNAEIIRMLTGFGYHVYAVRDFNSEREHGRSPRGAGAGGPGLPGRPGARLQHGGRQGPGAAGGQGFRGGAGREPKLLWHRDPALHHPVN